MPAPYEVYVDRVLGPLRLLVRAVPALVRRLQGRGGAAPAPRRARVRRPLPAADPPDRPHATARAATTRSSPAPTTRAARGRSATRPAATTRSTPSSGRSRTSTRSSPRAPRARHRHRARLRDQRSGDHPWLKEHPEWFNRRPDGTIKYAENPPKKYQDIYNLNWNTDDWQELWEALLKVVRHWVDHGVRVFRVDNPHTKPLPFWEWLIAEIHATHPDVIFLAEAFTRRAMMRALGEARLHADLHVLHVEELALGARGVRRRAGAHRGGRVLPAELLRQHAGHPHRLPRRGRPAGVRPAAHPRRDAQPDLRHLLRLRELRARASGPGAEEYIDNEKFEIKQRRARRPAAAARAAPEPDPARQPGAPAAREPALPRDRERRARRLRQARGPQHRDHGRQRRPAQRPGGARQRARTSSGSRRPSRSPTCSTASRYDWHVGAQLRPARPVGSAPATSLHVDDADDAAARPAPGTGSSPTRCGSRRAVFYEIHLRGFFDGNGTAPATSAG